MQSLISSFLSNTWTYTIVGGALATLLGTYVYIKFFSSDKKSEGVQITNTINNTFTTNSESSSQTDILHADTTRIVGFKKTAKILFIDNESLRDKLRGLNNAGWENVKQIREMENVDLSEIREADVVFIDYKGIGGNERDQGLAVVSALKARYGDAKWLILFTAYNVPVTAFDKGANDYLAKNSGVYETEQKIIKGLQGLGR